MFKKRTRPATVSKDIHAAIEEDKPAEGNVEDVTEEGPEEEPNLPSVRVPLPLPSSVTPLLHRGSTRPTNPISRSPL
ncbi:hypothetical protein FA13DRAFT_1733860 [Coprinellus micaceus]|jgi:hypothetical protein|uniref:Uncharacterized protein n=1 Tax=Coprinellus micaceus TaxID=71717 RepID=A0A4Y7T7W1_COPMI|nr:hypothetical protein FA13DRAFT_1733860 [Coprinellus micaceus]